MYIKEESSQNINSILYNMKCDKNTKILQNWANIKNVTHHETAQDSIEHVRKPKVSGNSRHKTLDKAAFLQTITSPKIRKVSVLQTD